MRDRRVRAADVMITAAVLAAAILAIPILAIPVAAQVSSDSAQGQRLPTQDSTDATPAAFLDQAKQAIAAGKIGAAQVMLEQAETRALARSVRPSEARVPSRQTGVQKIAQARQALLGGDRMRALALIGEAQASEAAEPD